MDPKRDGKFQERKMHELGVVKHVMKTLEDVAKENNVTRVASVTLQIGEVSGVVHEQLLDCWNWYADRTVLFKGSDLKIETMPAVTYCENCKQEYETVKHGRTCPYCGSEDTYLLTGNQFEIKEIDAVTLD